MLRSNANRRRMGIGLVVAGCLLNASAARGDGGYQQYKLLASDAAAWGVFGASVAVDGDYAVVGAVGADEAGAAYIFKRDGFFWTEVGKLTASDREAEDSFGRSVSIDGDVVVVGASFDDDGCPPEFPDCSTGSAYVFVKQGLNWENATETAKLTASNPDIAAYFGESVSIDGDIVVVGAPRDDYRGSAYVFVKPPGGWTSATETARLTDRPAAPELAP